MKNEERNTGLEFNGIPEEDIYKEAFTLMNMFHADNVSYESESRKEEIFGVIRQKIKDKEKKTISLKTFQKFITISAVAVVFIVSGISFGFYQIGYEKAKIGLSDNHIVVKAPYSTTIDVTLPDSSTVTLNAGSRLTYPAYFYKERKVSLEGEGYFDIKSDTEYPFILNTEAISVKVLGTRFNIKTYPEDEHSQVTLEEGLVEITTDKEGSTETFKLLPNQQFVFNNKTGEFNRKMIDPDNYTSWRRGDLIFKDVSLETIARELERRFNVRISIEGEELKSIHYLAGFTKEEPLHKILAFLSYKREWTYTTNGMQIIISRK